ncbi:MAG: hypothetical protein ACREQQ_10500 [Candidatus Binatia bacterium]
MKPARGWGVVWLWIVLSVAAAEATISGDRYEVQARLATQQTFHHDGVENIDWVQERNELRFDLKYDLIPSETSYIGIRRAKLNLLYRGRYDAIFDIRDHYGKLGYRRDDFRFPEGQVPREMFLDLEFRGALAPLGVRLGRQQVWRSMIGFDYLRSLGIDAARHWPQPFRSLLGQDQWLLSFQFFDEYYSHADNQIGLTDSVTDREQHFNPLFTFVATGFFVQQRFRPYIALAYDVNSRFPVAWLQGEYNIGKRWSVRIGDVMYLGSKNAEGFLPLNKYADRDNLFVRVTYFLL